MKTTLYLVLGIPSGGNWNGRFGMAVLNMMGHLMAKRVGNYTEQTIIPFHTKGSILPRGRLNIVRAARQRKATHIGFIDTDQNFPRDTMHRLIMANKDIIGCNIATKQIPASTTARIKNGTFWGKQVYTDPESPQYERVWRLGCGIMLVKMKVFEKLGDNCWEILWKPEIQDYQGEDWRFCELAEEAGFEIWVDHKLSNEVGHVGDYEYKHDVVGETVKEVANG